MPDFRVLADGKVVIDGYLEDHSLTGVEGPLAEDVMRLHLLLSDVMQIVEWGSAAQNLPHDGIREALTIAALVRLCVCFDGTRGRRQFPLKPKDIFSPEERVAFDRLKATRNKMVAHDEHLYPGEWVLAILGPDRRPVDIGTLALSAPISGNEIADQLFELANKAQLWLRTEYDNARARLLDDVKDQVAPGSDVGFRIDMLRAEDRVVKRPPRK